MPMQCISGTIGSDADDRLDDAEFRSIDGPKFDEAELDSLIW